MHSAPQPRVIFLGSGSSGNATVVSDGSTSILIDCGFSAREVCRRMATVGLQASDISAVFLTHEHSDHVRGLDVFCRRHAPEAEVMASEGTATWGAIGAATERCTIIRGGQQVSVGNMRVHAFRTSHDARESLGYRIETAYGAVGIVSDTGVLEGEALEALAGCTVLGIECNHDQVMLERGPYPAYLKRRIRSTVGHLSNDAASDALEALACGELKQVYALHRSRTNNTAALAEAALSERCQRLGAGFKVRVAAQNDVCDSDPPQQSLFGDPA